ncbi:MORN repeat variant family protein [Planoprotostelium fungivorum]|uniref:MORN repeat variant family protein n=1 Tax=Planoprotostelium fungivorum TaxID=1890364 RepID=A0A2P6NSL1_9EUKA|nr:MORN repeat variant family protein [Planoprotostelium fungivorum]
MDQQKQEQFISLSLPRARAPSFADVEVKMLLSNLNTVSYSGMSSDSEAESSELELEFDQIRGQIRRVKKTGPFSRAGKKADTSKSDIRVARKVPSTDAHNTQWWDKMKESMHVEQQQLLEHELQEKKKQDRPVRSQSTNQARPRPRPASWLEARETIAMHLEEESKKAQQEEDDQMSRAVSPTSSLSSVSSVSTGNNCNPLSMSLPSVPTITSPTLLRNYPSLRNEKGNKAQVIDTEEDGDFDEESNTSSNWWDDLKRDLEVSTDAGESHSHVNDTKNNENNAFVPNTPAPLSPSIASIPSRILQNNQSVTTHSSAQSTSNTHTESQQVSEMEDEEEEEKEDSSSWWDDMKKSLETTEKAPSPADDSNRSRGDSASQKTDVSISSLQRDLQSSAPQPTGSPLDQPHLKIRHERKLSASDTRIQLPEVWGMNRVRNRSNNNDSLRTNSSVDSLKTQFNRSSVTPSSSDNEYPNNSPKVTLLPGTMHDIPPVVKRGVLKFDNGVYRGDFTVTPDQYSLAHGTGTFVASNGETYVGQWKMGKRDGKGIKVWDDGREYTGDWSNNRRTGYGILTWKNGDVYMGEMNYGFQQGWGMFKTADDRYVGEWNVSERHGYGTMHFKNGDIYSGDWKHNKKDGRGIYRFKDGKTVEGEWVANVFATKVAKKVDVDSEGETPTPKMHRSNSRKGKASRARAKSTSVVPMPSSSPTVTPVSPVHPTSSAVKKDKATRRKTREKDEDDSGLFEENPQTDVPSSPSGGRDDKKKKKMWTFKSSAN